MANIPKNAPERDALIEAYFRHAAAGPEEEDDFWAWEAVSDAAQLASADEIWPFLLDLVRRAPDALLGNVAAGPLEHAIREHGSALVDRAETEAASDPRFQRALGGIWLEHGELPATVIKRLVRASGDRIKPLPASKRRERRRR